MQWDDSARARLYYRDRPHQTRQLEAAIEHAGDLHGKKILDVGCGYGDLIPLLPLCDYVGIDPDEEVVAEARKLWPNHTFRVSSRMQKADVVIAVASLQCCENRRVMVQRCMAAARERLVIVTCHPRHVEDGDKDMEWWAEIPHEMFPSTDDFNTFVVLSDP